MTGPEGKRIREEAQAEVADALAKAVTVRDRGAKIAEGWKKSRTDNNFRLMLRELGKGIQPHG